MDENNNQNNQNYPRPLPAAPEPPPPPEPEPTPEQIESDRVLGERIVDLTRGRGTGDRQRSYYVVVLPPYSFIVTS